jgi:archaellum biogenesis protein FlaJ (TadC family)
MYQELIQFFGKSGTKYFGKNLESLKELTEKSNLSIIYETYVGQLFFYSFLSINLFLVYFLYLFLAFWRFSFVNAIVASFVLTLTMTFLLATVFYLYPFAKYQQQKEDIERNMVFGISYMNIISKSGVPVQKTILYISKEKDFGEFSKEFERIHKYITFMGKDIVSSLKEVSHRTSSERFKKFIDGLAATISSGSDLNKYLAEESRKEIENYRERGSKYISIMSMFADIYIVMLLIAPLCVITILAVFSLMETTFLGFEITSLANSIVYLAMPIFGLLYLALLSRFKI